MLELLTVSQGRTARKVEPSQWRREAISFRVIVDARTGEEVTVPGGAGAGDKVEAGGYKAAMDSAIERKLRCPRGKIDRVGSGRPLWR